MGFERIRRRCMRLAPPLGTRSVAALTIERRTRINVSPTRANDAALSSLKTLQKFSSVHAQVHNHFNQERGHPASLQAKALDCLG